MAEQAPLGEFEVTILMAVLQCGDAATGTTVRNEVARRTGRTVARGAVYVTLDRLENKRLLSSRFDAATPERGGHPRRVFRVTPAGVRAVKHALAMLAAMREGLDPILGDV